MGEYKAGGDQRSFLLLAPDVMSEAAKQAATVARCLSKQMQVTLSLHFLTYCPVIRGATRRRHLLRSGCHVLGGEEEKAGSIVAPADETWLYRHARSRSLCRQRPVGGRQLCRAGAEHLGSRRKLRKQRAARSCCDNQSSGSHGGCEPEIKQRASCRGSRQRMC